MSESSVQSGQDDNGGNQGGDGAKRKPNVRRSNFALVGTIVVTILVVGLALGITKPEWQQYFTFGFTTREVNVAGDYFTLPNASKVKLAGVEVGRIDSVTQLDDGTARYVVRVQSDVIDKVGTAPSANVRPTTLLGGVVYMELLPGGDRTQPWNDAIPIDRTRLPVELSPVIQAIQPDAVEGIPATVNGLEGTLNSGGVPALKRLAREAPAALGPGAGVINALTGNNPGTDLPNVVSGLQQTTSVLARKDGQIEAILRDLRATSSAFAQSSRPTQAAIRKFPVTLDTARAGLARLSTTLDKLEATAPEARPTVRALDRLLARIDPVLVEARPVVNNLRFTLQETRPLVEDLVPAAKDLRFTFRELDPSLDRIRGPVVDALESGYDTDIPAGQPIPAVDGQLPTPLVSETEYTRSEGRRHTEIQDAENASPTLRQELGSFVRAAGGSSAYYDDFAPAIAFNLGFGPESIPGLPGNPAEFLAGNLLRLLQLGMLPSTGAGVAGPLRLPVPNPAAALPSPAAPLGGAAAAPLARPGLPLSTPGAVRAPAQAPARMPAQAPARPAAPALPGTGLLTGGAR